MWRKKRVFTFYIVFYCTRIYLVLRTLDINKLIIDKKKMYLAPPMYIWISELGQPLQSYFGLYLAPPVYIWISELGQPLQSYFGLYLAPLVYIWISELGQPLQSYFGLYRRFTITNAAEAEECDTWVTWNYNDNLFNPFSPPKLKFIKIMLHYTNVNWNHNSSCLRAIEENRQVFIYLDM